MFSRDGEKEGATEMLGTMPIPAAIASAGPRKETLWPVQPDVSVVGGQGDHRERSSARQTHAFSPIAAWICLRPGSRAMRRTCPYQTRRSAWRYASSPQRRRQPRPRSGPPEENGSPGELIRLPVRICALLRVGDRGRGRNRRRPHFLRAGLEVEVVGHDRCPLRLMTFCRKFVNLLQHVVRDGPCCIHPLPRPRRPRGSRNSGPCRL